MGHLLRVLIVEDSERDALLLVRELQRGGYIPTFQRIATARALQVALESPWDVVIADYHLAHFSALDALAIITAQGFDVPFIVVSDENKRAYTTAAMKAGAHDVIFKNDLSRLTHVIERELRECRVRYEHKRIEQARGESEQRFRKVFQSSPFPIVICRIADSSLRDVNESFLSIIGHKREDIMRSTLIALGLWSSQSEWTFFMQTLQSEGAIHGVGRFFQAPDGMMRELLVWLELIEFEHETSALIIFQDTTERRQAEERIHRQLQHLAALRRIQMIISASLDLKLTLNILLDHVTGLLGIHAADVLLLNEQTMTLEYAAGRGFQFSSIKLSRMRIGTGYAGRVAQERQPIKITDMRHLDLSCVRTPLLAKEGFIVYYGMPLIAKGQIKGVLELFHREPMNFDQEWVSFLESLAGQAAVAINNAELVERIQRSNQELTLAYDATIEGWVRALDLRDNETEGHSKRVTEMTVRLARKMKLSEATIEHVRRGALLHDIGKMGIPDSILRKPGPLTGEERAIMCKHPEYAYKMLSPIEFLRPALDIPYCHHEKWDGFGYPRGLKGTQIPLVARIFAVVDVWDALCFDRPYRKALATDEVRTYLREQAGRHFDPDVVEVFLQMIDEEEELCMENDEKERETIEISSL